MKSLYSVAFALLLSAMGTAQNATIQQIVTEVNLDTLLHHASAISGEFEVSVDGVTDTIWSRHKNNPGNELALQYLVNELEKTGLAVDTQVYSTTGKNVIALQTGTTYPDQFWLLCGHYDALPNGPIAPAADDDGSGTAAVIEAARVLSQYAFEYSILYAIWDEEEQGLVGSDYYAVDAANNNLELMGVINMDAIAWDGDDDNLARIHVRPFGNSEAMGDSMVAINTDYGINLNLQINNPGATYSDHSSFWDQNYGAVLVIEDFDNDPNPHYHTPTDKVEFFDVNYFHDLSKLSIASLASMAIPDSASGIFTQAKHPLRFRASPNPAFGAPQLSVVLPHAGKTTLEIRDAVGRTVHAEALGFRQAGSQVLHANLPPFAPGTFFYTLSVVHPSGKTTTDVERVIQLKQAR